MGHAQIFMVHFNLRLLNLHIFKDLMVGDLPCEYVEAGDLESANSRVEDFICEVGSGMHSE